MVPPFIQHFSAISKNWLFFFQLHKEFWYKFSKSFFQAISTIINGCQHRVHLYGYGSYGICINPEFSSRRLPYVSRDIVYAIAHIRGGGEMGYNWYVVYLDLNCI